MRLNFKLEDWWFLYLLLSPVAIGSIVWRLLPLNNSDVYGHVEPEFHGVLEAFRQNFADGFERDGAGFSVYYRGREVVNLWAGSADTEANVPWTSRTRTSLFSATKALASVVVALLVDRGYLSYEDRVVEYWPEYGQNGKENTTIEDVLTHKAGLPYLTETISIEDVRNGEVFRKIERAAPVWVPGTASGYHAVTFGFILDKIVQNADPQGRNIAQFFEEEINEPNDLSISIGVAPAESWKLARLTLPSAWEYLRDAIRNPKIFAMLLLMYFPRGFDDTIPRIRSNPSWITINYDTMAMNDPELRSLEIASVTGASNAQDLARLFSLLLDGRLMSNHTTGLMREPTLNSWHLEKVTLWPVMKGRGFFYERHPTIPGAYIFGHPGYGGQFVAVDFEKKLSFAYVSNGLKTGTGELCGTYMRLLEQVYRSIE